MVVLDSLIIKARVTDSYMNVMSYDTLFLFNYYQD
jgi:hypothetical protein